MINSNSSAFFKRLAAPNFSDYWIEVKDNLPMIVPRSFWKTKQASFEQMSACVIAFFQGLQKKGGAVDFNIQLRAISNLSAHWKQCKKENVREKALTLDKIFDACMGQKKLELEKNTKLAEEREKIVGLREIELKELELEAEKAAKRKQVEILGEIKLPISVSREITEKSSESFLKGAIGDLQILCSGKEVVFVHSPVVKDFAFFRDNIQKWGIEKAKTINRLKGKYRDFQDQKNWLSLEKFRSDTVENLIKRLYTGKIRKEISKLEVTELRKLAEFLNLIDITIECSNRSSPFYRY